ncbi:MAG: VOC family protein [Bacteroidia bacterium]|nr:VOC family protein [Bacteroidia bacterium]
MNLRIPLLAISLCTALFLAFTFPDYSGQMGSDLGQYSLSLSVKDVRKSYDFYTKLGFKPLEGMGSVEEKWIILSNGECRIGLFQDFFPSNTLTFNPTEARGVYKILKQEGISTSFERGIEQERGPCSFVLLDPDENSILIDQH